MIDLLKANRLSTFLEKLNFSNKLATEFCECGDIALVRIKIKKENAFLQDLIHSLIVHPGSLTRK